MDVEDILERHNVDFTNRPDTALQYVCPNCASFYSEATAPERELIWLEDKAIGIVQLHCDCHGDKTLMSMAVEINTNTPSMDWEKAELELILAKLEEETLEIERTINNYFD